ncbi:phosphatase PAP2 family protein [Euzebya tangerina]|uniref:phosphatase PAP2 family protein n=1 Tax=Euzebya tangerina TaxID=591198 RepID=UPI0013C30B07|nr:phosphatase PAP2 family protein [Euzebya tangerina]
MVRQAFSRLPGAVALSRATTDLGSMFMVAGAAAMLLAGGRVRRAGEVAAAGALGWTVAHQAKKVFDRPRPYEAEATPRLIAEPTGSSMPSGHAAVAMATATVLAGRAGPGRRWVWLLMPAWVPLTRIHLGVHYPTDTMAGLILGHGLGRLVVAVSDHRSRRQPQDDGRVV